jgi:hypothetical protein
MKIVESNIIKKSACKIMKEKHFVLSLQYQTKVLMPKYDFKTTTLNQSSTHVGQMWGNIDLTHVAPLSGLQINIWLDRTFVRLLLLLVGHNLNILVGQKPTSIDLIGHIYITRYNISHKTSMYSHSGTTLSKMLVRMPHKFYCKMQIEWICNRILSQQKNV